MLLVGMASLVLFCVSMVLGVVILMSTGFWRSKPKDAAVTDVRRPSGDDASA